MVITYKLQLHVILNPHVEQQSTTTRLLLLQYIRGR